MIELSYKQIYYKFTKDLIMNMANKYKFSNSFTDSSFDDPTIFDNLFPIFKDKTFTILEIKNELRGTVFNEFCHEIFDHCEKCDTYKFSNSFTDSSIDPIIYNKLFQKYKDKTFTIEEIKNKLLSDNIDFKKYRQKIMDHCEKCQTIPNDIFKVLLIQRGLIGKKFLAKIAEDGSIDKNAQDHFKEYLEKIFSETEIELDKYFSIIAAHCKKYESIKVKDEYIKKQLVLNNSYTRNLITRDDFNNFTKSIPKIQCIIKRNFFSSWKLKNVGECRIKINNTIIKNPKNKAPTEKKNKNNFLKDIFVFIKALIIYAIKSIPAIQKALNTIKLNKEYILGKPFFPIRLNDQDKIVLQINTNNDVCEDFFVEVKIQNKKNKVVTPTILQMEATECGAACLSIVLGFYGRYESLEKLRIACEVSRSGANFNNVMIAAKKYGLVLRHKKYYNINSLYFLDYPCLIRVIPQHLIVLEGMQKDKVYINDPGAGRKCITKGELNNIFMGDVLEIDPPNNFEKKGKKFSICKEVLSILNQDRKVFFFVILLGIVLIFPGLAVPTLSRIFIDEYLLANKTYWFYPLLTAMIFTLILHIFITGLQENFLLKFENKIAISKSSSFLNHLLSLPITFFTQRYPSGIASRIMLIEKVAEIITRRLSICIIEIIAAIVFFTLMLLYDLTLTLSCTFCIAINATLVVILSKKISEASQQMLNEEEKLISTAKNGLQMIETIKATGAENEFFYRWSGFHSKVLLKEQSLAIYSILLQTIPILIKTLIISIILIYGGYLIMQGTHFSIGMLVAYQSLMLSFNKPINNIVLFFNEFLQLHAYLSRINDIFRHEIDNQVLDDDEEKLKKFNMNSLKGSIELKDITFGFSPRKNVIKNFNLNVEPGKSIAIVGKSGSGKSTVAKLITGLLKPQNGNILFDNKKREQIPKFFLSDSLGIVDQEIIIFDGTIIDNLTLWDNKIPETAIIMALRDAHIHQLLNDRPNKLHTRIEECGNNFSGGQRQRFEIARSLAKYPKIIVLDEATSSLDPHTEEIVSDNIKNRGCTMIIIAHRLSTIRDCDRIIVMKDGEIVEEGQHEDLVQNKQSHYYKLVSHQ